MSTEPDEPQEAMIARLMEEGLMSTRELALSLPTRTGKKRSTWTVTNWIKTGRQGIRLEGFRGGDGRWYSSKQALARFFGRLTSSALEPRQHPPGED